METLLRIYDVYAHIRTKDKTKYGSFVLHCFLSNLPQFYAIIAAISNMEVSLHGYPGFSGAF